MILKAAYGLPDYCLSNGVRCPSLVDNEKTSNVQSNMILGGL